MLGILYNFFLNFKIRQRSDNKLTVEFERRYILRMCVPLQVYVIVSVHVLNTIPWAAFPAITFHIRQPQVERLARREKCSSLWRERIVWKWRGDVSLFAGKWILLPWNLTRNSVDSCVWKNRKTRNKGETEERG